RPAWVSERERPRIVSPDAEAGPIVRAARQRLVRGTDKDRQIHVGNVRFNVTSRRLPVLADARLTEVDGLVQRLLLQKWEHPYVRRQAGGHARVAIDVTTRR